MKKAKKVTKTANEVDAFVATVDEAWRAKVDKLRAAILASDPGITERIKWRAPSFCYAGDDRVTFRFPPKGGVQLIFHRGAKAKKADDFRFDDPTGWLEWAAPDRALLTLPDAAAIEARAEAIAALVHAWIEHTTEGA